MRILVLPSLIPSGRHTACCAEPKGWSATFNVLSSVVYLRRGGGQSTEGLVQGSSQALESHQLVHAARGGSVN